MTTISEEEAVKAVISGTVNDSKNAWSRIRDTLNKIGPTSGDEGARSKFVVFDEELAWAELSFALLALESVAVLNLFPQEQGGRLLKWTKVHVRSSDETGQVEAQVERYRAAFTHGLENHQWYENPMHPISAMLLAAWRGEVIEGSDDYAEPGPIDPWFFRNDRWVVSALNEGLAGLIGRWRRLKETFEIVPDIK